MTSSTLSAILNHSVVLADLGTFGEIVLVLVLVAVGVIIWRKLRTDIVKCPRCKRKNALVEQMATPTTIACESCDYCIPAGSYRRTAGRERTLRSLYCRIVGRDRVLPRDRECPQCRRKEVLVVRGGGPAMMVCKFCDYSRVRIPEGRSPDGAHG